MRYGIALFRSALFWIAFFLMSSISSIGGVIALPISQRGTIFFVRIWAQAHRLFCRFLLGQTIIVDGDMPDIPVLYVFKHESAFETVEQPMLFKHPAVFAKEELFAIPLLMPGALLFARLTRDDERKQRSRRAGWAILLLGAAQLALHLLLAQRIGFSQLLLVMLAGWVAWRVAKPTERRTCVWRRWLRWPAFALVIILWFGAGQAANAWLYRDHAPAADRRQVVMLTSLPLRWGGGGRDFTQMLAEGPADLPALTMIESAVDLRLADTLDGHLPPGTTLLLAHPKALTPHDLVRIDDHLKFGGNVVILADARSSWPPPHPLGDPRNPPVTSLLTPLFDHRGIELASPASVDAGDVNVFIDPDGRMLRLHSAGRFEKLPSSCKTFGDARMARCPNGRGGLWLVGDADLLHAELWQTPVAGADWLRRSDNMTWLVDILRGRESDGLQPLWIRPRR